MKYNWEKKLIAGKTGYRLSCWVNYKGDILDTTVYLFDLDYGEPCPDIIEEDLKLGIKNLIKRIDKEGRLNVMKTQEKEYKEWEESLTPKERKKYRLDCE